VGSVRRTEASFVADRGAPRDQIELIKHDLDRLTPRQMGCGPGGRAEAKLARAPLAGAQLGTVRFSTAEHPPLSTLGRHCREPCYA
jgi:hypothetical protein